MSAPDAVIYIDLERATHPTGFLWTAGGRRGSRANSIPGSEINPMASAFEHADLNEALGS